MDPELEHDAIAMMLSGTAMEVTAPPVSAAHDAQRRDHDTGTAVYRMLMGCEQADATIANDGSFDRHVLASILAVAAMEDGPVAERSGLAVEDLSALLSAFFPEARQALSAWFAHTPQPDDDEIAMVRDLLLTNCSSDGDAGRWLAAMIARRSMEPNHLWEDLGLRDRSELSRMLARHFAPLAGRNTNNMRWKRFFYRTLCESDGLVMCSTPVCSRCGDFDLCFGEESGESRLAHRRRSLALKAALSDAEIAAQVSPLEEALP